jgi:ADP-ribose pyrophosphatase YjhB (NUDIX family)
MTDTVELRIETVVYVTRGTPPDKEVLLIYRDVEPNKGIWVPLGETVLSSESPHDCAVRALNDSGLTSTRLIYKGLVTEVSPTVQWHLHLYEAPECIGKNLERIAQGQLRWVRIDELSNTRLPQADMIMGPEVLIKETPFFEAKVYFDAEGKLFKTDRY